MLVPVTLCNDWTMLLAATPSSFCCVGVYAHFFFILTLVLWIQR